MNRASHWLWTLGGGLTVAALAYLFGLLNPSLGAAAAALGAVLLLWRARQPAIDQQVVLAFASALVQGEERTSPRGLGFEASRLARLVEAQVHMRRAHAETLSASASALNDLARLAEGCSQMLGTLGPDAGQARTDLIRCLHGAPALAGELSKHLEAQREAGESGHAAAVQLDATHTAIGENVHALSESVDETAASIEEMTYSIKEVARNIEDLSLAAEQTATSMNQMDSSIGEVESNVQVTAQLADEVARDAGQGAEAVERTLDGIEQIRLTVSTASDVIGSLGIRIEEIGKILGVIEDVAEQTNLLALNAAIIAAQAGEHGRGFAVVAEEIKDLSDKTGASTKEIANLVRSIQEKSSSAVAVIATGQRNVAKGVELSREAEAALAKIIQSSAKSTQRFKMIAVATAEQARGSKVVADAVERIARSVQQVAAATAEQARGSEQLMRSAERIKDITQQVERTSHEQSLGSQQIVHFIDQVGQHMQSLGTIERSLHTLVSQATQLSSQVPDTAIEPSTLEQIRDLAPRLRRQAQELANQSAEQISPLPS